MATSWLDGRTPSYRLACPSEPGCGQRQARNSSLPHLASHGPKDLAPHLGKYGAMPVRPGTTTSPLVFQSQSHQIQPRIPVDLAITALKATHGLLDVHLESIWNPPGARLEPTVSLLILPVSTTSHMHQRRSELVFCLPVASPKKSLVPEASRNITFDIVTEAVAMATERRNSWAWLPPSPGASVILRSGIIHSRADPFNSSTRNNNNNTNTCSRKISHTHHSSLAWRALSYLPWRGLYTWGKSSIGLQRIVTGAIKVEQP
jgi:hypothetical protein